MSEKGDFLPFTMKPSMRLLNLQSLYKIADLKQFQFQ